MTARCFLSLVRRALGLAVILAHLLGRDLPAAPDGGGPPAPEASPRALVQAALQAEISGAADGRAALLAQALRVDPEFAPARWHAGFVRVGDRWLPLDEAEQRAAADPRRAEYRRLRDAEGGGLLGEVALGRWCRTNHLDVEARLHWLNVLRLQPSHEEALRALGAQWHGGQLLTHEQIKESKRRQPDGAQHPKKDWAKHWAPIVVRWRRAAERHDGSLAGSMADALRNVDDPEAIQALLAAVGDAVRAMKDQKAVRRMGLELVEMLDAKRAPTAAGGLMTLSLLHPAEDVRREAADALRKRPLESYVPPLLSQLRSPIEATVSVTPDRYGGVTYYHDLYQEGPAGDYRETRSQSVGMGTWPRFIQIGLENVFNPSAATQRVALRQAVQEAQQEGAQGVAEAAAQARAASLAATAEAVAQAAETQRRVAEANQAIAATNRRLFDTLIRATGLELAEKPTAWWDWWQKRCYDYYELDKADLPAKKPVYEWSSHDFFYVDCTPQAVGVTGVALGTPPRPPVVSGGAGCCFPRGTQVWTITGAQPIEQIKPGDQVLAQDPQSGELTYQPVLQTTVRRPAPLLRVRFGEGEIVCTRGHPLWVCGTGWKMAKELQAGQRLHSAAGTVTIDAIEEMPAPQPWFEFAHSLVVDGFHTYFVGPQRLLAHDNRLFIFDGPTPGVPGAR